MSNAVVKTPTHVVDILGNVKGRDQPIMLMEKACELVGQIPYSLFLDKDVVFFDPFCKAGEILLSCAFLTAKYTSMTNQKAFSLQSIQDDLYKSNRYFALAPDERHHRISLRTFLGNSNSHKPEYAHIIRNGNYLSEVDGTFDQNKFKMEFESMINFIKQTTGKKKIIAVGNPPYQEEDGGAQKSAKPIYQFFVQSLIEHQDIHEFVLVIPARWFGGGKGLDGFRKEMMESSKIKTLTYFEKSGEVFPTVDVDGGICFIHWSQEYHGSPELITNGRKSHVDLKKYDIIPDDPASIAIIDKVTQWKNGFVGEIAWSRKPFGLATDHFKKKPSLKKSDKGAVPCLSNGRTLLFADKKDIARMTDKIDEWKVCVPGAYGGKKGQRRKTLPANQVFMVEPGTIVTETYMVVNTFGSKKQAENFIKYLQTDFSRYLLGLRKITQHIPKDRWNWVPMIDCSKTWTDEDLYKQFKINKEEQAHIKAKLQEWS